MAEAFLEEHVMSSTGEELQSVPAGIRVPWQWSDPWAWLALALLVLGAVMLLRESGRDTKGLWTLVPLMLSSAADSYRRAVYLRKALAQPSHVNRQRLWAIAFLAFGVGALLLSWDTAPWN